MRRRGEREKERERESAADEKNKSTRGLMRQFFMSLLKASAGIRVRAHRSNAYKAISIFQSKAQLGYYVRPGHSL